MSFDFSSLSKKQKIWLGIGAGGVVLLVWRPWKPVGSDSGQVVESGGPSAGDYMTGDEFSSQLGQALNSNNAAVMQQIAAGTSANNAAITSQIAGVTQAVAAMQSQVSALKAPAAAAPAAAAPAAAAPAQNWHWYTVKKGDTLWGISPGHNWQTVFNMNKDIVKNPNKIYVGQKIRIPN